MCGGKDCGKDVGAIVARIVAQVLLDLQPVDRMVKSQSVPFGVSVQGRVKDK